MGMDVYGKRPKQNKSIEEFPLYNKISKMRETEDGWKESWKILDENKKTRTEYYSQMEEYENTNCGSYFRNNCWWWRPLWNYCYEVASDLISYDLWNDGHANNGAGLNGRDAQKLGDRLLETIANGQCVKYQADYMQQCEDSDDKFADAYPFSVENVERFAKFCIESGGFEIC